jgi:putative acetyltransferase
MIKINKALNNAEVAAIRLLFREYAEEMPGIDLSFQDFENELKALPGNYAPPDGCLLLAKYHEEAVGCIA